MIYTIKKNLMYTGLAFSLAIAFFANAQNTPSSVGTTQERIGAGIVVQSLNNADNGYDVDLTSGTMQEYLGNIITQAAISDTAAPTSNKITGTLQNIFIFMMGFVGISAFVVITYAGIQYASAGANPSLIGAARAKIWNALFGILIAAVSVITLRLINPDLINLNIGTSGVGGSSDTVYTHNGVTAGQSLNNAQPSGQPVSGAVDAQTLQGLNQNATQSQLPSVTNNLQNGINIGPPIINVHGLPGSQNYP